MQAQNHRNSVLCIGGLDPSGGAGLQADIEAISACGGHALPVASCLTVQNTLVASDITAVESRLIQNQARPLIKDFNISACKIGVIPNDDIARNVAEIINLLPEVPIVLDPVISASSGISFNDRSTLDAVKKYIFPRVTIITPNHYELSAITQCEENEAIQCKTLCGMGPDFVLLTGGDNNTTSVVNSLYTSDGEYRNYTWDRLPHQYHGSGCTLSSAIACHLGQGLNMHNAVKKAQQYTMLALKHAESLGNGQWIPNRNISNN